MRTLQRMLNSLTSNRPDSIIPRSGRLPAYLENLIDTPQVDILGNDFFLEFRHTYVVHSFFQILVSKHLIEAMRRGEVAQLGDNTAKTIREYFGAPGDAVVFTEEGHGKDVADWVNSHKGRIQMDFVIKALGTCILHNEELEEKWGLSFEELERRGLVGKEPPKRSQG